jgi:hypothetical protein
VGKSYGPFVWSFDAEMIEGDPQRFEASRSKFPQKHGILAQNPRIDPLIEIDAALHSAVVISLERCAPREPKVTNLGDNLFKAR